MKKYIIVLISLLWSIENNQLIAQNPVLIDIEKGLKTKRELHLSKITNGIQYIPLESNSISAISYISNIKILDSLIIVKTHSPNSLLSFNKNGKFQNVIGRQGRGPIEYNFLGNFGVDRTNNEIYLYGLNPSKILVYFHNGTFKEQMAVEKKDLDHSMDIEFMNNGNFVLMQANGSGNTPFSYKIHTNNNDYIEAIKPVQFEMNGSYSRNNEFSYFTKNNHFFIKENLLNDTIYEITPSSKFIPRYVLESGQYTCPVGFRQNFTKYFMKNNLKFVQLDHIFDCSNYLIFFFYFDKKAHYGFYNKSLKATFTNHGEGIINDIDGGVAFPPIYQINNELIGYINAMDLINHVNSEAFKNSTPKSPKKKKELEKLANSLNETDNPVLMLVKLKE